MPRYKLTLEYEGSTYKGFQRQANGPTVQEALEKALYHFTQQEITVFAAGRTDAGVHALGQVCHVDLPKAHQPDTIERALNFYLHEEAVIVTAVKEVPLSFHARFSARKRVYLYRILNRPIASPFKKLFTWHVRASLNVHQMEAAAAYLLGQHDFTTFRASQCQAQHSIRTLEKLHIEPKEDEIHFYVEAKSFLHHQVRNMVGSLYLVGCGRWQPEDVKRALDARSRCAGGPTAPAQGLYFCAVQYAPEEEDLSFERNPLNNEEHKGKA